MRYPRFKVEEFSGCPPNFITPCPFGIVGKTGDVIAVGSLACQRCDFFKGMNYKAGHVMCAYF